MINVQYLPCGHDDTSDDPKLIELDRQRAARGYLDALTRPSSECPTCKEEGQRQAHYHAAYGISMEDL